MRSYFLASLLWCLVWLCKRRSQLGCWNCTSTIGRFYSSSVASGCTIIIITIIIIFIVVVVLRKLLTIIQLDALLYSQLNLNIDMTGMEMRAFEDMSTLWYSLCKKCYKYKLVSMLEAENVTMLWHFPLHTRPHYTSPWTKYNIN